MQYGHYFYYFPDSSRAILETVSNTIPPDAATDVENAHNTLGSGVNTASESMPPTHKPAKDTMIGHAPRNEMGLDSTNNQHVDSKNVDSNPGVMSDSDNDDTNTNTNSNTNANASGNTGISRSRNINENEMDVELSLDPESESESEAPVQVHVESMYDNPHVRSLLLKNAVKEDSEKVLGGVGGVGVSSGRSHSLGLGLGSHSSNSNSNVNSISNTNINSNVNSNTNANDRYMHLKSKTISTSEGIYPKNSNKNSNLNGHVFSLTITFLITLIV